MRLAALATLALAATALTFAPAQAGQIKWARPIADFTAPKPGEHPRIIFRKDDLPEIRRRAQSEQGQVVLDRARQMIERRYTNWNAAAHAFLYLVTEEQDYADKAKEAARDVIRGRPDPDDRYTWPGRDQSRAGPLMAGLALAYDMAYDGWDEDFRREVADAILSNEFTRQIAHDPDLEPGAYRWGAQAGGLGLALLALRGDPEADDERIDELFPRVLDHIRREIEEGFSERGYYWDGHHPGRFSGNKGIIPFIQAYRNAAGYDLAPADTDVHWMSTKWIYELVRFGPDADRARSIHRGRYLHDPPPNPRELSRQGDFALGFGIVPERHQAEMLWVFNHIVRRDETDYDINEYPHFAAWVMANWPFDLEPRNPRETMPRILRDTESGYFVFRSNWTGEADDMIVTVLLGTAPLRGRGMGMGGNVQVLGKHLRFPFPGIFYASRETYFYGAEDGSGILSAEMLDEQALQAIPTGRGAPRTHRHAREHLQQLARGVNSLAVDYSGASGAPLLVVQVGPWTGHRVLYWMQIRRTDPSDERAPRDGAFTRTRIVEAGEHTYYVMTLQSGEAPEIEVDGDGLVIGEQTVGFDGEKLILGTIADPLEKTPGR